MGLSFSPGSRGFRHLTVYYNHGCGCGFQRRRFIVKPAGLLPAGVKHKVVVSWRPDLNVPTRDFCRWSETRASDEDNDQRTYRFVWCSERGKEGADGGETGETGGEEVFVCV